MLAALLALVCTTASVGAAPLATGVRPSETAHGAGLDELHRLAVPSARPKLQLRRDRDGDPDRADGPPSISSTPSSEASRAWPPGWASWAAAAHLRAAATSVPPAAALRRTEWMAGHGAGGREVSACRTSRGPPPRC